MVVGRVTIILAWMVAVAVCVAIPTPPPEFESCPYSEPPPEPMENGDTTDRRAPEKVYAAFEGAPRPSYILLHTGSESSSTKMSLEIVARGFKRGYPGLVHIADQAPCTRDDELAIPDPEVGPDGEEREWSMSLIARQEYLAPERLQTVIDEVKGSGHQLASVLMYTDCDSMVDLALQNGIPVSFYVHELRGQQFTKGLDMFARFYHVAPENFPERGLFTRGFRWEYAREYLEKMKEMLEDHAVRETMEDTVSYWPEYAEIDEDERKKDEGLMESLTSDVNIVRRMVYEGLRNAVVTTTHFAMDDLKSGARASVLFLLQDIVKTASTHISSVEDVTERLEALTLEADSPGRVRKAARGEYNDRFDRDPRVAAAKVLEKGYILVTPDLLGKSNCYVTQWIWTLGMRQGNGPLATVPLDKVSEYLGALMDDGNPVPRHILFADDNSCSGDQLQQFFGTLLDQLIGVQRRVNEYVAQDGDGAEFRFEVTLAPLFSTEVARNLQLKLVDGEEKVWRDPSHVQHAVTKTGAVHTLDDDEPPLPLTLHVIGFKNLHTIPSKVGHRIRRFPVAMNFLRDMMTSSFQLENMVTAHFDWKVVDLVSMPKLFVEGSVGHSPMAWRFLAPVCPPYKVSKAFRNAEILTKGICTDETQNNWSDSKIVQALYCDSLPENLHADSFVYPHRIITDGQSIRCKHLGKKALYSADPRYLSEDETEAWQSAGEAAMRTSWFGDNLGAEGDVSGFPGVARQDLRRTLATGAQKEALERHGSKRSRDYLR